MVCIEVTLLAATYNDYRDLLFQNSLLIDSSFFHANRRIYKIFMRKEMTVIRLTDASLMFRLGVGLAFEIMMLGIMQAVDPVMSQTVMQSALPRDQTIYYCAPSGLTMVSLITGSY
jgi:hypothetical protein